MKMTFHQHFGTPQILWILGCLNVCLGFYLPGLAPVNYCRESESSSLCKVSVTQN